MVSHPAPAVPVEPRRSGRSTKGQHPKLDILDPVPASTPSSEIPSDSATPEPGLDDGSDAEEGADADGAEAGDGDDEIIRCVCGEYEEEEDIERDMICCDGCSAWQHNDCMGLAFPKGQEPDEYFCERCRPDSHAQLLAAMARGEKPWEEAARIRAAKVEELKRRKKGKKGGRKSTPSSVSKTASTRSAGLAGPATAASPPDTTTTATEDTIITTSSDSKVVDGATQPAQVADTSGVNGQPLPVTATLGGDGTPDQLPATTTTHRKRKSEHLDVQPAHSPAALKQRRLDTAEATSPKQQQPAAPASSSSGAPDSK
ncbi:hypothetical protein KEM52_001832, partial [Ascosphaera acerosa]